jgi:hypothetical protein
MNFLGAVEQRAGGERGPVATGASPAPPPRTAPRRRPRRRTRNPRSESGANTTAMCKFSTVYIIVGCFRRIPLLWRCTCACRGVLCTVVVTAAVCAFLSLFLLRQLLCSPQRYICSCCGSFNFHTVEYLFMSWWS